MRKFYGQDLQHQYEHDQHFKSKVDQSEETYSKFLQKSIYFNSITAGIPESLLQKFIGEDNHQTYFFYGYLQPPPSKSSKQLLLYLVRNFQPEPGVPFTFVYFNQKTPSSDYYFKFKNVFDMLPLRVIEGMRSFYLIKPYFYIKAFDMFGQSNKIFSQRYQTLQNCDQLLKRQNIKVHDFVTFVPEIISEQFPSNIKRRPSLLTYRINVEGQNLNEEQRKQKHEFEQTIKALFTKQVYKLQNYELGELGIPVVLQYLISYFKEKPQTLKAEGIFRKSVSIDEENQTLLELSSRNFGYLQQITNPHLIASLIKKFFSNLKEPIIPFALFDKLLHDQGVSNKRQFIRQGIRSLPTLNFLCLMFVLDFLREDLIPIEKETKMSGHNLAICFSPAFMRSEKASFADIVNASKSVTITEMMITEYDFVFGSQLDRSKLYKKSMIDRRKDLKKSLREELDIQINDRASEEVRSFIHQDQHPPSHQKQILPTTPISKQLHKNQHQITTKSEIKIEKTQEEISENIHRASKSQIAQHHYTKQNQAQNENEGYRWRKSKHDMVERYLKNQNKLQQQSHIDFQKEFGSKQEAKPDNPNTGISSSVTRSTLNVYFQQHSP